MKNMAYQFSVLRYVHDTATQEFVNIGVAIFAPEIGFLQARCTDSYARISALFAKVDGAHFRQIVHYIETQIQALGKRYTSRLPFEPSVSLESLLTQILPADDSAFQFSRVGVGVTQDPRQTLAEIFHRQVETYLTGEATRRSDDDVWRVFREPLDRVHVTSRLKPKRIVAPDFEYEFERSWKNEVWRVYEPVSFDLIEEASILDKANRWFGRVSCLSESREKFRIYFLLGEPRRDGMRSAFTKAQNILHKIPGDKDFIRESDRDSFASELANEIDSHGE
jgi:Protein of unknown function (DUF3037)